MHYAMETLLPFHHSTSLACAFKMVQSVVRNLHLTLADDFVDGFEVRIADLTSVFPAGLTAAASWDREVLYARGAAMAKEFKGKGAHLLLG